MTYVIKREDKQGYMLSGLGLGELRLHGIYPYTWTKEKAKAIKFNKLEGLATINFITCVINENLGEYLYLEKI